MEYIPYLEIAEHLPIERGDVLFVSSDIGNLFRAAYEHKEKFDANKFIDALIEKIGNEGTLVFPTYNWGFCNGETFDYKKTSCKTGALGATALRRNDFKRTKHPIYSFAVWGKDRDLLINMNNESSFGADSPFAYFHNVKAKNLIIDVEYTRCFTFVHYVEEASGNRTYRYTKFFTADYIDEDSNKTLRSYSMLVRDLDLNVQNDLSPVGIEMEKAEIARKFRINDIFFTIVDMNTSFDLIMKDIKENKSRKICKYIGQ